MKLKDKKISLSIVIIIILSLIATGIIVSKLIKPADTKGSVAWFFQESIDKKQEIVLKNAYIISGKDGTLEFLYENETYSIEGNLSESFSGVADIVVNGKQISKIYAKPDATEGILSRYTSDTITLNDTELLNRYENVPVYITEGNQVLESDWDELIVGTSLVDAVMENGQVSALIIEEVVEPSNVNVLLRNGDSIYYSEVYIRKVYENTLVNVNDVLKNNSESFMSISDKKGLVLCDASNQPLGEAFEGDFFVFKTEEGLVLVNRLPVESYLKYVLPSEMPKTFSHEALKAQVVCARTYAYSQMKNGSFAEFGANLDDTTNYQVYHAFGRYAETDAAVEETKGQVILCNDQMINCYYFSCSAGVTNDLSVWGDAAIDYISMKGLENLNGLDLTNEKEFSEYINSHIASNDSEATFYRWEAKLNIENVQEESYGKLKSVKVKERNQAGYITELLMTYEKEKITLTKESDIRKALGLYLSELHLSNGEKRTNFTMIPSACFEVAEISDGKMILHGGGYGHGIGLSQYGANKMAQDGKTYEEIIKYYYSNVKIDEL